MTTAASILSSILPPLNTELPARQVHDASDDHALMLAVRHGDIDRLGELFERHHQRLYAFCLHLGHQPAAAEDIVQNIFHRILKYRHTYRDDGNFTTWMYHLARTCAADFFLKQAATPAPADPADFHAHTAPGPSPAASAAQGDDLALLRTALAKLPAADREILVLSHLQNLTHKETARILDCSEGAAKVRAHRALKTLRETYHTLCDEIQNPFTP